MRRPGRPASPSRPQRTSSREARTPERARRSARDLPDRRSRASAYDVAVRYLGPRPRSILEVRRHLAKKCYDEREAAEAVRRLREQGYLDDAAFTRYWLEQRDRFRPKGLFALKAELRAKGVDAAVVDAVVAEQGGDEAEAARRALEPRLARWRALEPDERRTKAQAFLRQRGFPFDVIEEVLARL